MMTRLEKDKKSLPISESDRKMICEKFAFKVFATADDEDRAGNATMETARTFNAAGTFFDILEQFGELSSEVYLKIVSKYYFLFISLLHYFVLKILEKRKYAKFKTIEIAKAIKEGRKPSAGAPTESDQVNYSSIFICISN